jgi:ATP-binding cassette, subfamily B, bacterial
MDDRQRGRWSAVNDLVRRHRIAIVALSLVSILGGLAEALFLVVVTYAALVLASGEGVVSVGGLDLAMGMALALSAVLVVVRLASGIAGVVLSAWVTSEVMTDLRLQMTRSYLEAPWPVQRSEPVGRLQQLLVTYTQEAVGSASAITSAVSAVLSILALIGVGMILNPAASLMVIVVLIAMGAMLKPLRRMVNKLSSTATQFELEFSQDIADLSRVNLEIEVFGIREQVILHLSNLVRRNKVILRRVNALMLANHPLYISFAYVIVVIGMVIISVMNISEIGSMSVVMLITLRSLVYGQQFQNAATMVALRAPYLDSLEESVARYRESRCLGGDIILKDIGQIEVTELSFSYDGLRPVLDGLTFTIQPGEIIGIVGPSGCGKTTLVHLLLGLRQPSSGRIMVGGYPLEAVDRCSWANLVGFVPQDAGLVSGTIDENIRFFRKINREIVNRAVMAAHLIDEIAALPKGLATVVGSHGNDLSGGQRQRLAIARALVSEPKLLILDEPTASLDTGAELHIRETLARLGGGVTVIVVAHRLSTLRECDRIMVLEDGSISAFDRPAALSEGNRFFQMALRHTHLD